MINWTLRRADGTEKTFEDWGLGSLTRTRVNQATDTATFTAAGANYDGDLLFEYGSTVKIFADGIKWFEGRVIEIPRFGTGREESMSYKLAGPWWYLEDLGFRQLWNQAIDPEDPDSDLELVYRARIVLNQDHTGDKLSSGEQIAQAVQYAIDAGRPLQLGVVDPAMDVPWDEMRDVSCAEVIRKMLRWSPDAVTWFDYTTTPPTLHIRTRPHLETVGLTIHDDPAQSIEITPRYDLQRSVVILNFETPMTVDDKSWSVITPDKYPLAVADTAVGALVMTVELGGGAATYQKQFVRSTTIVENGVNWWRGKLPWLRKVSGLTITGGEKTSPDESPIYNLELVEGAVADWMGRQTSQIEVKAKASYKVLLYPDEPEGPLNPVVYQAVEQLLTASVVSTNAPTNTFTRLNSFTASEPVPVGLAQGLYEALSVLHYDGRFTLEEEECSGLVSPGKLLNLIGSREEWETMAAEIQSVTEQIDSGTTEIKFGPPRHLGLSDMVELLRAGRGRQTTWRLEERVDGTASGKGKIEGTKGSANALANSGAGAVKKTTVTENGETKVETVPNKITLKDAEGNTLEIKANSITCYKSNGEGFTLDATGWLQLLANSGAKQVYLDAAEVGSTNYAGLTNDPYCDGEEEKSAMVLRSGVS